MGNTYWMKLESGWDSFGVQDHPEFPNPSIRRSKLENLKSELIRLNDINPALAREKLETFNQSQEPEKRYELMCKLKESCEDRPEIKALVEEFLRNNSK